MNDREFLMWLHARLTSIHGESPMVDYMHKLRSIIKNTPVDRISPDNSCNNSLHDLRMEIQRDEN